MSYNKLMEKIIQSKTTDGNISFIEEVTKIEDFLNHTSSQITYYGIMELHQKIKDEEYCVLFRNNHFSVLYKHNNELCMLVTDQGFLNEPNVVWENLCQVNGDSAFLDERFQVYRPGNPSYLPDYQFCAKQDLDDDYQLAVRLHQMEIAEQERSSVQSVHESSKLSTKELPRNNNRNPTSNQQKGCVVS
eukprot:TRINITY_DN3806_c0_g1_i2.p1 TRINITY_DN3806_c0_g1~~TRINITY_DN3806_c0_g1_i2.p1  ORF type:complete len:189 (+),score=31.00 TRINITY_DN3806_c0_g1_i2:494-1060(+)